jgi:8-oxo-dGTP diphosphatase
MYCFPGGGIESKESEQQALVREIREELGVPIQPIRCVWRSVTPWKVRLAWWLSRLEPVAQLTPDRVEVESVHWLTTDEMADLPDLLASNHHFLQALRSGNIDLSTRSQVL